jgi:hypothetical protein
MIFSGEEVLMVYEKVNLSIFSFLLAVLLIAALPADPSDAQMPSAYASGPTMAPGGISAAGLRAPGRYLQGSLPGLADPTSGYFFLPPLQAELRIRCLYQFMSGELERISTGERVELADELGLVHTTVIVQPMGRIQIGRLSLRLYGDMYTREIKSPGGSTIYWPTIWFGSDFDVIERETWSAGLTFDITPMFPSFTIGPNPLGELAFHSVRPTTVGLFFRYNPPDLGGITPSIEARIRRSTRTGTRLNEGDISVGLKTPETVLGTVALRAGWRYTTITAHDEGDFAIYPNFSAYFFDLVHYY